jgi:hypothetical protein
MHLSPSNQQSNSFSKLLEILKYRNNKTISIVNDLKTKTLDHLKEITADAAKEGKRANTLATNTQMDSLSVKALTSVATGLLPATLLAVMVTVHRLTKCLLTTGTDNMQLQLGRTSRSSEWHRLSSGIRKTNLDLCSAFSRCNNVELGLR